MDFFILSVLAVCVSYNLVDCNTIYGMNILNNTAPECSGPTSCFVKPGMSYTLVFNFRVDKSINSVQMRWQAAVGKPRPSFVFFKKYGDDQILFKDYSLCRGDGNALVLRKRPCPLTRFISSPKPYNVTVHNVKMPKLPVTEKLYLSNGKDKAGTLGLIVQSG